MMPTQGMDGLQLTIPPRHPQRNAPQITGDKMSITEKPVMGGQTPMGPPGGALGPPGGWLCQKMTWHQEIIFNIMVAFLQLIPQSTLTTVFPVSRDIARSFSIRNPSVLPWLVAAYALLFGTFILVGGRLGDIFGHKTLVVLGYCFLSCWSVVAGLSHYVGYELFFVARGFQGIGASLMVPNGLAVLGRTYPPGSKKKIFSFTIFGLCAPVGAYLGMIFGALFTKFAYWWWSFYTLAIVSCLLAACAHLVLPSPPPTPKQLRPVKEKLGDMDWLGAITGVGGLICVQVALVSAPASGWNTQYIFMLLIIGVLLMAFFIITELKIASQPLVPFKMLKAEVGFVLGAVACGWATFGIWTWFLWRYLLGVKRETPLDAAVRVVPIVPVAFIASILTAWMMRKCRPSWTLFWALVAFTLGPLLLAIDPDVRGTPYWTWTFVSLLIMPFGMDMSFPAATFIMSNFFPPQQQGVAGSLISTVVNYSISLGLGLASTVEVHVNSEGRDPMAGIRGGWLMGVGLGGLGIIICVAFVIKSIFYPVPSDPKGPGAVDQALGNGVTTPNARNDPDDSDTKLTFAPPQQPADELKPRSTTVSSGATTMVPDSSGSVSPQQSDIELYKSFNFDTSPPSPPRPSTPRATPTYNTLNNSTVTLNPNAMPNATTPPPPSPRRRLTKDASSRPKSFSKHQRRPQQDNPSSFVHSPVNSQSQPKYDPARPSPSTSTLPPLPLLPPVQFPAELEAAYRGLRGHRRRD
ncbi:MFS general substrate transporter, partial [Aureobasidium melanogenum]